MRGANLARVHRLANRIRAHSCQRRQISTTCQRGRWARRNAISHGDQQIVAIDLFAVQQVRRLDDPAREEDRVLLLTGRSAVGTQGQAEQGDFPVTGGDERELQ